MIRVVNWDQFQHYKDRNPPWIKVYRTLLTDPVFIRADGDAVKVLVVLWLVASEHEKGLIEKSPEDLAFVYRIASNVLARSLKYLHDNDLLECDSNVLAWCQQHAIPEERRGEQRESRGRAYTEVTDTSKPDDPVVDMWAIWMEELGGNGKPARFTAKRRQKLRDLYREQLADMDNPLGFFRDLLRAVQRSDHHMSKRAYQMPESLFINEDRRDRWVQDTLDPPKPNTNGSGPPNPGMLPPIWD